jgi:hypothetical protein
VTEPAHQNVVHELIPHLKNFFRPAFERYAIEADEGPITWELTILPLPAADDPKQLIPMVILYVEIPGARSGISITGIRAMESTGYDREVADIHVREVMADAFKARSQQLAQEEADATAAAEQGVHPPTSGLITLDATPNPPGDDAQRAFQRIVGTAQTSDGERST